jgi:hypothetical protein
MTVSSTTVKNSYSGNGSNDTFVYGFKIFADTDLEVIIRSATGTETIKTLTTHYTVTGAGSASGGNVVFTAGNIPTATETVVVRREVPQTQAIDYIANDPFPAESHEEGLDRATMTIQQLQEEVNRSIKLSATNTMTSTEFTVGATDRANKILAFDSSGELSVTQELGTFKGSDTTTTTAAYLQRDIIKSTTAGQLNNVYICVADSIIGDTLTDTDHFALLVDAYSAASSATAAAASAVDAQSSEDDAAADLVLTNADVVLTNADVVLTNADVVLTNADVVLTNADAAATAADLVATNQDTIDTAADLVATNQDTIDTAADLVATNQDTIDTAADLVLTNADVVLTHADVVLTAADAAATALDKIATNADVVLTGADVISAAASASAAAASADAFDDVYLGSKSSDPTTDNDGDPLAAGMLYYNTVSNIMRIYSGSAWENVAVSTAGFATLAGVETLTNKTLTSPKINEDVAVTSTATELNLLDGGADNVGIGLYALSTNTTANENTGIGAYSLSANTTGTSNTAIGKGSLQTNSTGGANTAVGHNALIENTTASNNVAIGKNAMACTTTGANNTAVGFYASQASTTGYDNVAVGINSSYTTTTGNQNASYGTNSLKLNTTGYCNTAIGTAALCNLTTGYNNIGIGRSAGADAMANFSSSETNKIAIGNNSSDTAYVKIDWTVTSDLRDKTNIGTVPHGLYFVNQLNPISYQFKTSRENNTPSGVIRYGFKAQEILALEGENNVLVNNENEDSLKLTGAYLIPVLVNAIKELKARIETLEG